MYDPELVQPMRDEVTRLGVKELRTPKEVEEASSCRHVADLRQLGLRLRGRGRATGLKLSMMIQKKAGAHVHRLRRHGGRRRRQGARVLRALPSELAADRDHEGRQARQEVQRQDIEGRDPASVAKLLTEAFDQHC
jgi:hypothetical protein